MFRRSPCTILRSIAMGRKLFRCGRKVKFGGFLGYVVDIKEVNTDNCPQGYKELISYYWPGTYDGCYCQTMVANHATEYIMQVLL